MFTVRAAFTALGSRALWPAPQEAPGQEVILQSSLPRCPRDQESTVCSAELPVLDLAWNQSQALAASSHILQVHVCLLLRVGTAPGDGGTVVGTFGVAGPGAGRVEPLPSPSGDPPPGDIAVLLGEVTLTCMEARRPSLSARLGREKCTPGSGVAEAWRL